MMQKLPVFYVFFIFTLLGYTRGLNRHQNTLTNTVISDLSKDQNQSPKNSMHYAISIAADEIQRSYGIHSTTPSTVEIALQQSELTPHENDLFRALGNDQAGIQLRQFLIASNHASELPGTQLLVQHTLEDAQQDPKNTLESLKNTLNRIPASAFPLERAAVLSLMDTASPHNAAVKAIALEELTQNPVPPRAEPNTDMTEEEFNQAMSTAPDLLLPISAHLVFLNSTSNPTEALQGTLQAIQAQPDKGLRQTLTSQFLEKYPHLKKQFETELQAQGINLPGHEESP